LQLIAPEISMAPFSSTVVAPNPLSKAWAPADGALVRPGNATPYAAHKSIGSAATSLFKLTGFFRKNNSGGFLSGMKLVAAATGILITDCGAVRAHL
jgi:hypothetical protein